MKICSIDMDGNAHLYECEPYRLLLSLDVEHKVTYRVGPCPFYEFHARPDDIKVENTLIGPGFMCTGDGVHKCHCTVGLLPMCSGERPKCALFSQDDEPAGRNDEEYLSRMRSLLLNGKKGKVIWMNPDGSDSNDGTGPHDAVLTLRRVDELSSQGRDG